MMRDNYREICEGKNLRANLASLRAELSDAYSQRDFAKMTGKDYRVILDLLGNPDPKVRKNACAVLAICTPENALGELWYAYQKEKILFVRPAYLKAIASYPCGQLTGAMKEQEKELMLETPSVEEQKHRSEELTLLRKILSRYEKHERHAFVFPELTPEVILITNRLHTAVTREQIRTGMVRMLSSGIRVGGGDLRQLLSIRTVEEYLFPIPGLSQVQGSASAIGEQLSHGELLALLEKFLPAPDAPYYFRIDVRGNLPADKKGAFIRLISDTLERASLGRLRSSASDYECEIRLLRKKDGSFFPCVKLSALPDERFAYRRGQTSESISPVNAALVIALAKEYLREGAQVMDPFAGVGTMLIERAKAGTTGMLFATDTYGDAIRLGRENAALAEAEIAFIHRDFLTFAHDYPFDEIISDLPRSCRDAVTGQSIGPESLYRAFFRKLPSILKEHAVLILYTPMHRELEEAASQDARFHIEKRIPINERAETMLFIIRYEDGA